jgi:hypothetical protein
LGSPASIQGITPAPAPGRSLSSIWEALMPELDWDRLQFSVLAAVLATRLTVAIIRRAARRASEPEGAEQ